MHSDKYICFDKGKNPIFYTVASNEKACKNLATARLNKTWQYLKANGWVVLNVDISINLRG